MNKLVAGVYQDDDYVSHKDKPTTSRWIGGGSSD